MSTPPPARSLEVEPVATAATMPPLGRPVRRRIAFKLTLAVAFALAVALAALHDSVRYYRVTSGSMQPTLPIGSRVAVEPGVPVRLGEIVFFHPPAGAIPATPVCGGADQGTGFQQPCGVATAGSSKVVFVKRVVAGPGDLVSISAGRAVVNGVTSPQPFASACGDDPDCNFPTPIRIPAGHYYVLGDDRAISDDSRFWGPIPASAIIGVVVSCEPLQTACRPWR